MGSRGFTTTYSSPTSSPCSGISCTSSRLVDQTTQKTRGEIREEYFKTYDVMTGVRIAATLGGLILFFGVFLLYKTKCKPQHHCTKPKSKEEIESTGIEYKMQDGVNNVRDSLHAAEGFHSYAHFQARLAAATDLVDGGAGSHEAEPNGACSNQLPAPSGETTFSGAARASYSPDNSSVTLYDDDIQIQIRTPTPCESPLERNSLSWASEGGACGGEPLCVLVPNQKEDLLVVDTSETKC